MNKNAFDIIIPHIDNESSDIPVLISPYHRWEHLYIYILQNYLYKYDISIKGFTLPTETIINIKSKTLLDKINQDEIIKCIKYKIPCKLQFKKEIVIINSEIDSLSLIYKKALPNYEYNMPKNHNEMLLFRRYNYNWQNIKILFSEEQKKNKRLTKFTVNSPQYFIKNLRNEMLEYWKNSINDYNILYDNIDKNFILFVFSISQNCECYDEVNKIIHEMECETGFINHILKYRFLMSYLFWPSIEFKNNQLFFTLFTFMDIKYSDILRDRVLNYFLLFHHRLLTPMLSFKSMKERELK